MVSAIGHEPDTPIIDLVADLRAATPTDAAKRVVPDVADERDRVNQARDRVRAATLRLLDRERQHVASLRSRPVLADPLGPVTVQVTQVGELRDRCERAVRGLLRQEASWVEHAVGRVRALSPRATLLRGYAILSTDGGEPVRAAEAASGEEIVAMLADGTVHAQVTEVHPRKDGDG